MFENSKITDHIKGATKTFNVYFEVSYDVGKTWERDYTNEAPKPVWDRLCAFEEECRNLPPEQKDKIRLRISMESVYNVHLPEFKPRI